MAIILPFQWDSGNLKHMMDNHANGRPYYPQQLESVFNDPAAHFTTGSLHTGSMEQRLRVVGSDHSGSVLLVNHIIRDGQIRVVTSWPAKKGLLRDYRIHSASVASTHSTGSIAPGSAGF